VVQINPVVHRVIFVPQQVLELAANLVRGAEIILDIGIGTGNLAQDLINRGLGNIR
jgi:2-polyprenyl-3-methyl-5-hydroxy-6-metoxy-1,4-benzoquinol methylase